MSHLRALGAVPIFAALVITSSMSLSSVAASDHTAGQVENPTGGVASIAHLPSTATGIHAGIMGVNQQPDPRRTLPGKVDFVLLAHTPLGPRVYSPFYVPFAVDAATRSIDEWLDWYPGRLPWVEYNCDRLTPTPDEGTPTVALNLANPGFIRAQFNEVVAPHLRMGMDGIMFDNVVLVSSTPRCGHYASSSILTSPASAGTTRLRTSSDAATISPGDYIQVIGDSAEGGLHVTSIQKIERAGVAAYLLGLNRPLSGEFNGGGQGHTTIYRAYTALTESARKGSWTIHVRNYVWPGRHVRILPGSKDVEALPYRVTDTSGTRGKYTLLLSAPLRRSYHPGSSVFVGASSLAVPITRRRSASITVATPASEVDSGRGSFHIGDTLLISGTHADSNLHVLSVNPSAGSATIILDPRTPLTYSHAGGELVGRWTPQYQQESQYQADVLHWASRMHALIKNHFPQAGITMNFGPANVTKPQSFYQMVPFMDISFMEEGFIGNTQEFLADSGWQQEMLACEYLAAHGKGTFINNYLGGPLDQLGGLATPSTRTSLTHREVNWALANYLLVKGNHTYVGMEPRTVISGRVQPDAERLLYRREYRAPIGRPIAAATRSTMHAPAQAGTRVISVSGASRTWVGDVVVVGAGTAAPQTVQVRSVSTRKHQVRLDTSLVTTRASGEEVEILPLHTTGAVYLRSFTGGLTLVNPSSSNATFVNLSRTYYDLYGHRLRRITMQPRTGLVLVSRKF